MMSNEDDEKQLVEAFFSLWQAQCAAYLHQADVVGGALHSCMAATQASSAPDSRPETLADSHAKEPNHAISDDAVASLFRYLVAQLPQRGNSDGTSPPWENPMGFPSTESGKDD